MNRRDLAINTLLGLLLVLIFAVPLALGIVALGFVSNAVDLTVKHFLPGFLRHSDLAFNGLWSVCFLVLGFVDLHRRRWLNGFLCFAAVPMILSFAFGTTGVAFGDGSFLTLCWYLVIMTPGRPERRSAFMACAFGVTATFAINTGMLGSGTVARIMSYCVILTVVALLGIQMRHNFWLRDSGGTPSFTRT
jgi:hypothetical protein